EIPPSRISISSSATRIRPSALKGFPMPLLRLKCRAAAGEGNHPKRKARWRNTKAKCRWKMRSCVFLRRRDCRDPASLAKAPFGAFAMSLCLSPKCRSRPSNWPLKSQFVFTGTGTVQRGFEDGERRGHREESYPRLAQRVNQLVRQSRAILRGHADDRNAAAQRHP